MNKINFGQTNTFEKFKTINQNFEKSSINNKKQYVQEAGIVTASAVAGYTAGTLYNKAVYTPLYKRYAKKQAEKFKQLFEQKQIEYAGKPNALICIEVDKGKTEIALDSYKAAKKAFGKKLVWVSALAGLIGGLTSIAINRFKQAKASNKALK